MEVRVFEVRVLKRYFMRIIGVVYLTSLSGMETIQTAVIMRRLNAADPTIVAGPRPPVGGLSS